MKPNFETDGMSAREALRMVADCRGDRHIIVTNQGSARLFPQLSSHALDFNYNPSTMGGAIPLGLGIALAQPERHVVVVSGDGSLLMSLGTLVSVAASGCANLSVLVLDNGRYEVTGGQETAGERAKVDFAQCAEAAGIADTARYRNLEQWQADLPDWLDRSGPKLASLRVQPCPSADLNYKNEPMQTQIVRLTKALSGGPAQ